MKIDIALSEAFLDSSDVAIIMENTAHWAGRNVTEITAEEYTGLMTSHVLNGTTFSSSGHALQNCSLTKNLDTAAQGTGLAFIVMADVFTKLPGAPFWSLLFFSMLLSLGIGSQIGILEGFISTLFDMPTFKRFSKPVLSGNMDYIRIDMRQTILELSKKDIYH